MIQIHNSLEGKNLCNIFASLVVKKINSNTPNAISEIKVIDLRNFFIVRGSTTSDIVINPSEIFSEFLEKYDKEKSESLRVIDVISYKTTPRQNYLYIKKSFDKKINKSLKEGKIFLDSFIKENVYFNIKINEKLNTVFYDSKNDNLELLQSLIKNVYQNYNIEKIDLSNEIYISDRLYGISDIKEIYYYLLLENISNHLFSLGISKKVDFILQSNLPIDKIDENNINFEITNNEHIVKKDWLESLILDVFPFDLVSLENYFGVSEVDLITNLLENSDNKLTFNLKKAKDFLLV